MTSCATLGENLEKMMEWHESSLQSKDEQHNDHRGEFENGEEEEGGEEEREQANSYSS